MTFKDSYENIVKLIFIEQEIFEFEGIKDESICSLFKKFG